MTIKLLTFFLALFIFFVVIELIRQEKLTFKYASGWLFVSFAGVFLTIFDKFLFAVAHWAGFQLTSNFIFFALLSIFVFLSLVLTVFLCQQEHRNNQIAQKIAHLEHQSDDLHEKVSKLKEK